MSRSYETFISDVASEICMESLAENLNLEDIDFEAIVENAICYDQIADSVENNVDFQCMVDEWCSNNLDLAEEIVAACINVALDKRKAAFKEEVRKDLLPWILGVIKQNRPKPWWHRLKFWRKRT